MYIHVDAVLILYTGGQSSVCTRSGSVHRKVIYLEI